MVSLFFSFFLFKNLFNETKKVKPKFLHSVTGQNEYSTSRSGTRIYKAFSQDIHLKKLITWDEYDWLDSFVDLFGAEL